MHTAAPFARPHFGQAERRTHMGQLAQLMHTSIDLFIELYHTAWLSATVFFLFCTKFFVIFLYNSHSWSRQSSACRRRDMLLADTQSGYRRAAPLAIGRRYTKSTCLRKCFWWEPYFRFSAVLRTALITWLLMKIKRQGAALPNTSSLFTMTYDFPMIGSRERVKSEK